MKLDEIVAWYQKKIGTYDKQQWEKTVEQRILDGFTSVTLKTAKLKTDLIDVDLVRGSTFPKAKPKQTLLTVIRLAILRYIFLPVYAQWWVKQTSPNVFALLLFMYVAQMINWAVYTYNIHRLENTNRPSYNVTAVANTTHVDADSADAQVEEHIVSISELLIPMALSLLLSLIHSQIVATNTASGSKTKRRRFSNASQTNKPCRGGVPSAGGAPVGGEPRFRRRKKMLKNRSQDIIDAGAQPQRKQPINPIKKYHPGVDVLAKTLKTVPLPATATTVTTTTTTNVLSHNSHRSSLTTARGAACNIETCNSKSITLHSANPATCPLSANLTLNLRDPTVATPADSSKECFTALGIKKRNVNWHSPIDNSAVTETSDKQQQTSPQIVSSSSSSSTTTSTSSENNSPTNTTGGESSRGSPAAESTATVHLPDVPVRIEESVLEFYDDLISRSSLPQHANMPAPTCAARTSANGLGVAFQARRNIGEDDGFESLNGKSSSGEESNMATTAAAAAAAAAVVLTNQLRLRLNSGDSRTVLKTEEMHGSELLSSGYRRKVPLSSESDFDKSRMPSACDSYQQTIKKRTADASSDETEDEGDDGETVSSPNSLGNNSNYTECTTSATEWLGVTTNSDDCSYSSELGHSDNYKSHHNQISDEEGFDLDFTPATILNPHGTSDRISCTIWEQREIKKAQMSVLEISSCIIERVESMPETNDYIYIGIGFSVLLSLIPSFCRLCEVTFDSDKSSEINYLDIPMLLWEKASFSMFTIFRFAFGHSQWERTLLVIGFVQRLCLTMILFIIFAVAERTFKQRFLYAKLFSHLTSTRRARKSNVPHFRLNKVRNIKTWLSVRSYLKKRGPQRSVDVIVSAAFIVTLLLLAFLSVEWLKDSVHLHSHLNLEALLWSTTIGIFLLRFMTLGNKIHHKYRSVSVLITEQINLYLQIEQKPKKKDELMVSNSVLKLAADLLKELESPFKISGLSANPYLFTTIKVVILSALSGVLSEMLGFKLKLHKIKIK